MTASWKLLTNVKDDFQANQMRAFLASEGIQAFAKMHDNSGVTSLYMGTPLFGIDLFVLDGDYDRARELIEAYYDMDDEPENPSTF